MNMVFAIDLIVNFFSAYYDSEMVIIDDFKVRIQSVSQKANIDHRESLSCRLVCDRLCVCTPLWSRFRVRKHVSYSSLLSNWKDLQTDPYHENGASCINSEAQKEQIFDLHQQTFENRRRFRAYSVSTGDFYYFAACNCMHMDFHRFLQWR